MRWWVLAVALLLVGFDHAAHDEKAPLECRSCHAVGKKGKLDGRPGHAQCFGACHGAAPKKIKKGKATGKRPPDMTAPVCAACHGAASDDLGMTISHAGHADDASCESCHTSKTKHDRCMGCHRQTAPTVDECTGCHVATAAPAILPGPMALGVWSHDAHAKKAPKAGCATCHGAIASASGAELPAPAKADCASCHQTSTEDCTSCHRAAPKTPPALVRPTARFSHEEHRGKLGDCATCHAIDRRGEAAAPGHAACADGACHATDFASITPTTCASCHTAIEPWRALIVDAPPKPRTEFGAEMPHRTHAQLGLACESCHTAADGERQMRPPHGHASCAGDACHGAARAEPSPALDDCAGCHRAGLVAARVQERLGAKWTVRARFAHAPHESTCTTCHTGVWNVDGPPPPPEKKTCEPCHDGAAAFKMTGHGCARCHGS